MRRFVSVFFYLLVCATPYSTFAVTSLVIEGAIIEAVPCDINDGKAIDINFGDAVAISKIDGSHYAMPLTLNFTCSSEPTRTMTVKIQATVSGFDNSAVQTDIGDLAIRLTKNGNGIALNTPLAVNYPSPLTLMSTPVKRAGAKLLPGDFNAFSTAVVDYL
ncbi:pilus assembly protein [Buttiauxella sp. A111]|nr:pilus assembly protein [Buttiauxella sp. A111]